MTKNRICKLALCVLFLSPLAPLATANAQNAPVMGTDPQPINPHVMGTDPQPITPALISILVSVAIGIS